MWGQPLHGRVSDLPLLRGHVQSDVLAQHVRATTIPAHPRAISTARLSEAHKFNLSHLS